MTDAQDMPPRKGRGFRWVLGISLALNLLFIGAFAGAALRHVNGEGGKWRAGPPQSYGGPLARALPREARRALRRDLHGAQNGLPSKAERQTLYRDMLDALRAKPFEAARVEAVFATQGDVAQKVQTRAQETWLSLVAAMPEAERLAVADRLEEALRRPRRKGKRHAD